MNLEEIKKKCTGVSIATINLGNEYSLTEEVQWLISKVEQYETALNTLLTKNDWLSVEEVEGYIRENLK